jgi:hypothetical protein
VTLQLVQVRLPPGYAANASPQRSQQVHSALYSHGTTLLASTTISDKNVVWTLSNSLFPAPQQLSETQKTLGTTISDRLSILRPSQWIVLVFRSYPQTCLAHAPGQRCSQISVALAVWVRFSKDSSTTISIKTAPSSSSKKAPAKKVDFRYAFLRVSCFICLLNL